MRVGRSGLTIVVLLLVLVPFALIGCKREAQSASTGGETAYVGALDVSYEGALDATSQLALGTLRLEGTPDALTEAQARELLPLWRVLQGNELQGAAERRAVVRQIEGTMADAQTGAIAAMRLTEADAATWAERQASRPPVPGEAFQGGGAGGGRQRPGGAGQGLSEDQIAQMRQQFQNMSPEERATRGAQFAGQAGRLESAASTAAGSPRSWIAAVTQLLVERSGASAGLQVTPTATVTEPATARVRPTATPSALPVAAAAPAPTATLTPIPTPERADASTPTPSPTPEPVAHLVRAGETLATIAQAHGVTVNSIVEANAIGDPNAIHVGQRLLIPAPGRVPTSSAGGAVGSLPDVPVPAAPAGALTWLPDTDPGPPFSVEVRLSRAIQDPLVEQSRNYKVTGLVRNDGEQTYAVSAIHVTFYDASGFRGVFQKAPGRGRTGGEWIWHGKTEADFGCLLLAPGEACPFSVEITAQDMASFLIHPDAVATDRQSVPVWISDVAVREDGTGFVRITGTATNGSPYKAKGVTVSGVLLDESGQIVSVGSTYVLGEEIEPGEAVPFDLRVEKEPYTSYQLYAQAERDWD